MRFRDQSKLKAITFSYDDGTTQDIQLIELLNKYGLKATFNLNSGLMGRYDILNLNGKKVSHYKIAQKDVKRVYEGHEVAVHTVNHAMLPQCDDETVIYQVEQDRLALSDIVGYEVVGMAYSCGGENNDDRVAKIIRENTGVRYARGVNNTDSFAPQDNLYRFLPNAHHLGVDRVMTLAKRFFETETDTHQVFYIWGHAFELDTASENWVKLEELFKFLANRDDVFYGTNTECLL